MGFFFGLWLAGHYETFRGEWHELHMNRPLAVTFPVCVAFNFPQPVHLVRLGTKPAPTMFRFAVLAEYTADSVSVMSGGLFNGACCFTVSLAKPVGSRRPNIQMALMENGEHGRLRQSDLFSDLDLCPSVFEQEGGDFLKGHAAIISNLIAEVKQKTCAFSQPASQPLETRTKLVQFFLSTVGLSLPSRP